MNKLIRLRFHNPGKAVCCILLGPELCQNPAFYVSKHGNRLCEAHRDDACEKWTLGHKPDGHVIPVGSSGYLGCDKALIRRPCENPPMWSYSEIGDKHRYLCGFHAEQFRRIRPGFEQPRPKGYGAQRIDPRLV